MDRVYIIAIVAAIVLLAIHLIRDFGNREQNRPAYRPIRQEKRKKFSLPEEFYILQDFLSLRLLFCCRMCYTIIGLQRQYAVIFIECMISKI